ncbi:hypothetical protein AKJ09_10012 [Labilithrix luteola]|uniref:VOC domain-containing protein n=1 Tax=Labilithrix luteola TaxID=1391654 RepID=A0A0K1QC74_9BACT|nr:VOC family protein [Labilithrix luteola]AKV03349.1 hypothetical protein AKJ09_10012 [Labilithrix luteola]
MANALAVQGIKLHVYPVKDLEKAKAVFTKLLGTEPYADSPYYVGFKVGDQEIGLDPNAHRNGITAPLDYFQVADVETSFHALVKAGVEVHQPLKEVSPGLKIAIMKDADGNLIGLTQK